ncbi:MAG: hypothetical protein J5I47_08580 [Vicingus serpentipes]|nr:hypothetical protein [Vicingus serpentipes]
MLFKLSFKSTRSLSAVFIGVTLSFTLLRLIIGGFNFSYFIVAGSDFVNEQTVNPTTIVNDGQGYDGQFFYRYAHHPLNKNKTAYGVTVDHIEYRIQRIVYPATVWLFSFGGNKNLIPFYLVFVNVLLFIGLFYLFLRICEIKTIDKNYALLPLFLFGAYMSLARDTSEIFEVFFFVLAIYAIIVDKSYLFVLSIFLSIFSRETSIVATAPLTLLYGLKILKSTKLNTFVVIRLITLTFPFIAVLLWKYYLHQNIGSEKLVDGSQNISFPFHGIFHGILSSINFSTPKNILETFFWFLFLIWNCWFNVIVIKRISWSNLFTLNIISILSIIYLIWTIFSIFLGHAIYIDDWGFVRIFTLWNMLGFIIIALTNQTLKKYFLSFSIILLALTLFRLIIRV